MSVAAAAQRRPRVFRERRDLLNELSDAELKRCRLDREVILFVTDLKVVWHFHKTPRQTINCMRDFQNSQKNVEQGSQCNIGLAPRLIYLKASGYSAPTESRSHGITLTPPRSIPG